MTLITYDHSLFCFSCSVLIIEFIFGKLNFSTIHIEKNKELEVYNFETAKNFRINSLKIKLKYDFMINN